MPQLSLRPCIILPKSEPGFGLATANVIYRLPDHPRILQTFLWQVDDEAPGFPRLSEFLDFWIKEIDALIHTVEVSHVAFATKREIRHARFMGLIH